MAIDLTALIAKAKVEAAARTALKEAKTKAAGAATPRAKAEATAEVLGLTITLEWRATADVLRVIEQTCACGHTSTVTEGRYILHEHIRLANATRLVRRAPDDETPGLLRRLWVEKQGIPLCQACAPTQGFLLPYIPPTPPEVAYRASHPGHFIREWNHLTGDQA